MAATAPDPRIALAYGLIIFQIQPGGRLAPPGWTTDLIGEPGELAGAWVPGANVGIACRASNIVGIDLDHHHGGPDGTQNFTAVCARARRPWPSTLTVRTPHGRHLYFRAPPSLIIPSLIHRWPGIDVRAPGQRTGGYLIGPDSVVGGRRYVIELDRSPAPLPAWLAQLLTTSRPAAERAPRTTTRLDG